MKNLIIPILLLSCFSLTSCKASSDKDDIDQYVKVDLKKYATDNYRVFIEANKNFSNEPALKETLFNNTYVKLETARSLLNEEYSDWVVGLDKNGFDYADLNTVCWMTVYMENYVKKINVDYKKDIKNETLNDVHRLYEERKKIIKLRDSKNQTAKNFVQVCS
ncbi:hypothetical protein [Acinetobacter nosocomialis]|uniref:hypothetical protein n=1 Tax=Acinetobacter nosocomialis TaxID=106654 RepID=UPI0024DEB1FF|nr:hypothetical protein [Acinetobacter nosocomialis]